MEDTLDLDALAPTVKKVKVNGQIYDVLPLKLKDYINLQAVLKKAKGKTDEEMVELMGDIFKTIKPIVPKIDDMNLTIPQTIALIQFIYSQEQLDKTPAGEPKKGGPSETPLPSSSDTTPHTE